MKTKELKKMLEIAEQLGIEDIRIAKNDSRDGKESYSEVIISFAKTKVWKSEGETMLLIS